jgi:cobalt-zinc-cadmium efflux system outer membrane protein
VAARERTRIGAAPPVDGLRAQAVEAERAIERRAAEAELREVRRRLALQWGAAEASFDSLVLPAATIPELPTPDSLLADLERSPERLRAAAETAVEAARVREARAQRIPDLALHGGVRQFRELSATGFVAGVSLELPLWNRAGARIQSAEAGHRAAVMREHSERLRLEQELRSDWERLMAARDRSEIARTREQPAAQRALADLDRGYRAGRFTFLDQLDGQRAAVEAELRVLETERDLWNARFELERLLGTSLERAAEGHR